MREEALQGRGGDAGPGPKPESGPAAKPVVAREYEHTLNYPEKQIKRRTAEALQMLERDGA